MHEWRYYCITIYASILEMNKEKHIQYYLITICQYREANNIETEIGVMLL